MKVDLVLLEKLCDAIGVSGGEKEVRDIILKEIKDYVDDVHIDSMGNLIARKSKLNEGKPRLLLDAHMDEVGFMIVNHDGDGFYAFQKVGGIDDRILPGLKVLIGENKIPGVISSKPIHLASPSERKNPIAFDGLKIDTGGNSAIEPGTRAGFGVKFRANDKTVFSKAIDDRIGIATLILLAKQNYSNLDIFFTFTVQEEIGLRGAKVSAKAVNPHAAIVVDATPSYDQPTFDDQENTFYNTKLGKGPAIYTLDSGTLYDHRMINFFAKTAEAEGINFQFRQPGGGGTNAGAIHLSNAGIPTISISVPHRSTHSPISASRISDWEGTIALIDAGLKKFHPTIVN